MGEPIKRLSSRDPRNVDYALVQAFALPLPQRISRLQEILQGQHSGRHSNLDDIVSSYLGFVQQDIRPDDPATRIRKLEAALQVADANDPDNFAYTLAARLRLAEAYDKSGKTPQAQAQLKDLLERARSLKKYPYKQAMVVEAQAWFYMDKGKNAEAIAFLQDPMAKASMEKNMYGTGMTYAWALLFEGHAQQGLARMLAAIGNTPNTYARHPVDLAYAYVQAGKTEEAQKLFDDKLRWRCTVKESAQENETAVWEEKRAQALDAMSRELCHKYRPAGVEAK